MSTAARNAELRAAFEGRIVSYECERSNLQRLSCVLCWDLLTGVVRSCDQRHAHCDECKLQRMSCSVEDCARQGLLWQPGWLNHREEELMAMVKKCTIKCIHFQRGCDAILKSDDYRAHLKMCNFRDVACLYTSNGNCNSSYAPNDWIMHFRTTHNVRLYWCLAQDILVPFIWDRPLVPTMFLPMGILRHRSTYFVVNVYMAVVNEVVGQNQVPCANLFFWVSTLATSSIAEHGFEVKLFQRLSTGDRMAMTAQGKVLDARLSPLDMIQKQRETKCVLHVLIPPTSQPRVNQNDLFLRVKVVWDYSE